MRQRRQKSGERRSGNDSTLNGAAITTPRALQVVPQTAPIAATQSWAPFFGLLGIPAAIIALLLRQVDDSKDRVKVCC